MRIILTGGAGFIGSWVADHYLKNSHEVLIIDNLSSGKRENVPSGAELVEADIRDTDAMERIFKEFKPEAVNHHAAQTNVRVSVDDPQFDAAVNIIGTLNVLENSRKAGVKKFIFASTGGAIYGEPEILPADESVKEEPLSPYGVSKLCTESYLDYYKKVHGLSYVALRYANVYGQRQNPHGGAGIVAIFCTNMLNGTTCKIFGNGEQTRDYIHCEDVAMANNLCLTAPDGVYNIGTSVETSINSVFNGLKEISGSDCDVQYLPGKLGDVKRISLSSSLANREFQWVPRVTFHEGLKKTWEWFSKNSHSE